MFEKNKVCVMYVLALSDYKQAEVSDSARPC